MENDPQSKLVSHKAMRYFIASNWDRYLDLDLQIEAKT